MSGSSFWNGRFHLLDTKVAHKLGRDLRVAVPHILRTFAGVDTQELEGVIEAPPTDWVEFHGNPTVVPLEWVAVAMEAGSGEAFQSKGQEAVGNTELPEVAGVS